MKMGKTNNSTVPAFGMKDRLGYMFGDFGNDFTFILSSMFMMKFYTDVMGLSAGVVGMLMMAARFVDAFTDVTMGQIVDRSKPTKDGKFRPWIKRMCGPVAIASFLFYQSGLADMPYGVKVAYMVVTYLLWGSIFYTSINIPYGSMASAISPDPTDRASLSTWRSVGASLASLVIGTGTPLVAYVTVDGNPVLSGSRMTIIAGVFSVLAVICYLLCYNLVRERVPVPANNQKLDIVALGKSLITNRALLGIIAAALLLLLALLSLLLPFCRFQAKGQDMTLSGVEVLTAGGKAGYTYLQQGGVPDDFVLKAPFTWGDVKEGIHYADQTGNSNLLVAAGVAVCLPVILCFLAMCMLFLAEGKKTMVLPTIFIAAVTAELLVVLAGFTAIHPFLLAGVYLFALFHIMALILILFAWTLGGYREPKQMKRGKDGADREKNEGRERKKSGDHSRSGLKES